MGKVEGRAGVLSFPRMFTTYTKREILISCVNVKYFLIEHKSNEKLVYSVTEII
jgi:hypothetical protein